MLTTAFTIFLLPVLTVAQYGYGGGAGTTTAAAASASAAAPSAPSAPPDTSGHMNIDVAFQSSFTFHPSNITAPNNTVVTFWYPSGALHSVTQSSFASPCTYLAASSNSSAGFDSGLQSEKQFSITIVDDTKPIWFHCKQVGHCGQGMVGSINAPPTGNTFDAFQRNAMQVGSSVPTETDSGPVTGGVNGIATATPAATATSASTSTKSNSASAMLVSSAPMAFSIALLAAVLA